jgi:hypothetical protein
VPLLSLSQTRRRVLKFGNPRGSAKLRLGYWTKCGSPVPNPLRTTAYYWVPAGLLDDLETLETGAHRFTGSRASWETIPSDAPHFETVPKLSQLIELFEFPKAMNASLRLSVSRA